MKKEALINIIINDLKEVQQLMEAFRGESVVSSAFVNLAKTKIRNIEEEVSLLEQEFGNSVVPNQPAVVKVPEQSTVIEERSNPVKAEVKEEMKFADEPVLKDIVVEQKSVVKEVAPPVVVEESKEDVPTKKEKPKEIEKTIKPKSDSTEAKKHNTTGGRATLADVLNKDRGAVNENVSRGDIENDLLNNKPVGDVRKAMGINDRFFYQRELFEGNVDLFNQTLDQLNKMDSFDDASNFLISNFDWDGDSDVPGAFLKIVKRRFL